MRADLKAKAKTLLKETGCSKFSDPELDIFALKEIAALFAA